MAVMWEIPSEVSGLLAGSEGMGGGGGGGGGGGAPGTGGCWVPEQIASLGS